MRPVPTPRAARSRRQQRAPLAHLAQELALRARAGLTAWAAAMPDPATAGTPMPGQHESPHVRSPSTAVRAPGKAESAAESSGPLVRERRADQLHLDPRPHVGDERSMAAYSGAARSALSRSYSADPRVRPSHTSYGSMAGK